MLFRSREYMAKAVEGKPAKPLPGGAYDPDQPKERESQAPVALVPPSSPPSSGGGALGNLGGILSGLTRGQPPAKTAPEVPSNR